jgi:PAS domain S-box-containing protein
LPWSEVLVKATGEQSYFLLVFYLFLILTLIYALFFVIKNSSEPFKKKIFVFIAVIYSVSFIVDMIAHLYELHWIKTSPISSLSMLLIVSISIFNFLIKNEVLQEQLKIQKERLTIALESTNAGFWEWNPKTNEAYYNENWANSLGYKIEELYPLSFNTWEKLVHPDDLPKAKIEQKKHLTGETDKFHTEFRMRHKNGHWIWFFSSGKIVEYDEKNRPARMIGVHFDIDKLKKAEESLKAEKELLEAVTKNIPVAITLWTDDGKLIFSNPIFHEMVGWQKDEIDTTEKWFAAVHPNEVEREFIQENWPKNIKRKYSYVVLSLLTKEKGFKDFEIRSFHFDDQRILFTMVDITEKLEKKRELDRTKNYITNIINSMPSVIIGIDKFYNVTHWNKQAEKLFDITVEKARSQNLFRLLPYLKLLQDRIERSLMDNIIQKYPNLHHKTNTDDVIEDVTVFPLSDDFDGAVLRIDDVTERVNMEEMMIQSEKMLSVGGLAAGIAHEINNPLAGIMQNTSVIMNRLLKKTPKNLQVAQEMNLDFDQLLTFFEKRNIARQLQLVFDSGERASRLVKNMLSFARKSDSKFQFSDVRKIINNTIKLMKNHFDISRKYDFKKIDIQLHYQEELKNISCEETKLQQVFMNILKNGGDAMFSSPEPPENPTFTINVTQNEMITKIEIQNNGPAIPANIKKRIFEPFYTTKSIGKGTGLGLSVSYFIITKTHQGKMWVVSDDEKGTRFIIELPNERKS